MITISNTPGTMLGTVQTVAPITVLLDGSSSFAPANNFTRWTLAVGDRVVVSQIGSQLYVVGDSSQLVIPDSITVATVTGIPTTAAGDVSAPTGLTVQLAGASSSVVAALGTPMALIVGQSVYVQIAAGVPVIVGVVGRTITIAEVITDWNAAISSGLYNASGADNAPASGWFIGEVITHSASYVVQTLRAFTGVSTAPLVIYERRCVVGTWGQWNAITAYTPWVAVTPVSGFTGSIFIRSEGGRAFCSGLLSGTLVSNGNFFNIPAAYKPVFPGTATWNSVVCSDSGGTKVIQARIWTSNVILAEFSGTAPTTVDCSGLHWPIA